MSGWRKHRHRFTWKGPTVTGWYIGRCECGETEIGMKS